MSKIELLVTPIIRTVSPNKLSTLTMARAIKSEAEKRITQLKRLILKELKKGEAVTVMTFKDKFPHDGTLVREAAMRLVAEKKALRVMIRGRIAVTLPKEPVGENTVGSQQAQPTHKITTMQTSAVTPIPDLSKTPIETPTQKDTIETSAKTMVKHTVSTSSDVSEQKIESAVPTVGIEKDVQSQNSSIGTATPNKIIADTNNENCDSISDLSDVLPGPLLTQRTLSASKTVLEPEKDIDYQEQLKRAKRSISEQIELNSLPGNVCPPSECPQSAINDLNQQIRQGSRSRWYFLFLFVIGCLLLLFMVN